MSVNVLPDLDSRRMRVLGKNLNRNRKLSLIHKDKQNSNLDVYVKSINKAEKGLDVKHQAKKTHLKRNLVYKKSTQKVLRTRRQSTFIEDTDELPFGIYEGESLNSYRREIDEIVKKKDPKLIRQMKVEKFLKRERTRGTLLGPDEAREQFEEIMELGKRRQSLLGASPLSQTFLNLNAEKHETRRKSTLNPIFWKDPSKILNMPMKAQYSVSDQLKVENAVHDFANGRFQSPEPQSIVSEFSEQDANFNKKGKKEKLPRLITSPVTIRSIDPQFPGETDGEYTVLPAITSNGKNDNSVSASMGRNAAKFDRKRAKKTRKADQASREVIGGMNV